jgi:hypothetical protein
MQQESISSHFKSIKRKSALEAKGKISSLNGISSNNPKKQYEDSLKPIKIIPGTTKNANRVTLETSALLPLKRRSTRINNDPNISNRTEKKEFEIPKTLEKNKKLNLEEIINKKRKREEESFNNIKSAKALLMQKRTKNPKKNGNSEINESLADNNSIEFDESFAKSKQPKELKNTRKSIANNVGCGLLNNDLSEKTKTMVKKILENKSKNNKNNYQNNDLNENNLNKNLNNKSLNVNESSNRNFSSDKNYISDDVLDTVEETLKNKNKKNLISKLGGDYKSYKMPLRERKPLNAKLPNDKANSAINNNNQIEINNISEEAYLNSPTGNSLVSTNSTDLNNNSNINKNFNCKINKNEISENNNNNFELPSYVFNKLSNDFSFEKEAAEAEANLNTSKIINNISAKNLRKTTNEKSEKNLLLSMEANTSEFKKPELSEKTLKIIKEIGKLKEERQNNFKREENKTKEKERSESSFSLKFKYEELVKKERELLLPAAYKKLLVKFGQLDQTLNFFKISKSNKVPSFTEIKRSMENTYKE